MKIFLNKKDFEKLEGQIYIKAVNIKGDITEIPMNGNVFILDEQKDRIKHFDKIFQENNYDSPKLNLAKLEDKHVSNIKIYSELQQLKKAQTSLAIEKLEEFKHYIIDELDKFDYYGADAPTFNHNDLYYKINSMIESLKEGE